MEMYVAAEYFNMQVLEEWSTFLTTWKVFILVYTLIAETNTINLQYTKTWIEYMK
jgi:hypothetical protein